MSLTRMPSKTHPSGPQGRSRAIMEWLSELTTFRMSYLVPHPPQDLSTASLFQGFTPGILDTTRFFTLIPKLPADIRELFSDADSIFVMRRIGAIQYYVSPVETTALRTAYEMLFSRSPFLC